MISLEDRYRGCLVGLACGDALGGPVEFVSREEMDRRYPDGLREFIGGGWLDLAPGEITDDTQMALEVARSLCAHPEADITDLVDRFLKWQASDPKDIGNTTRDALDRLAAGVPWDEAGKETHKHLGSRNSAGNGAIMRCAPVALRFRNEPDRLRAVSTDVSRTTHANPLCTWASIAVDQALVALLNDETIPAAIELSAAGIGHDDVRDAITHATIASRDEIDSGGFVLDTMSAAFWALLQADTFEDTVVMAVGLGEDSDTTGAVAGALAGAHYGYEAIPAHWRDSIQSGEELTNLARCLLEHSSSTATIETTNS